MLVVKVAEGNTLRALAAAVVAWLGCCAGCVDTGKADAGSALDG